MALAVAAPAKRSQKRKTKAELAAEAQAAEGADKAGPSAPPAKRRKVEEVVEAEEEFVADLFVFGSNPFGALGLGEDETVKYRPAQVLLPGAAAGAGAFRQVACGGMHTVALDRDGQLWTWGVNDEGALGRKSQGSCWEDEEGDKEDSNVPGLAQLPAGVKAVQVGGARHLGGAGG